jgi:hypothetical protein
MILLQMLLMISLQMFLMILLLMAANLSTIVAGSNTMIPIVLAKHVRHC